MKQKITQMRLGRYLFTALLTLLFVSCGKSSSSEPTPSPQPEPGGYIPPKSHIYKDEKSSPVAEVRSDGTVVYEANTAASELPKVGEIIVSGVTDAAPQGFIYKVESVTMKDGKAEVKTSPAFINDVIKDYNGVIPVDLSNAEIDSIFNEEGKPIDISLVKINKPKSRGTKLGTMSIELTKEIDLNKYSDRKTNNAKVELKVSSEISLNLIYYARKGEIHAFGTQLFLENSATAKLKTGNSLSSSNADKKNALPKHYKLGEIKLKPITVQAGGIPIVITPRTEIYYIGSLRTSDKVEMTLLDIKGSGSMRAVLANDISQKTAKHLEFDANFNNPFENFGETLLLPFKELENAKLGLSIESYAAIRTGLNLSFFNFGSYATTASYAEMGVKFRGGPELSPQKLTPLNNDTFSGSFYVSADAKLKFNVLGKGRDANLEQKLTLLEAPLWRTPFALTPIIKGEDLFTRQ